MRIPTRHAAASERAESAMTPMIDVVFLLLIFFLWTASFQAIESVLPSQLTISQERGQDSHLEQEDFEQIVVRVTLVGEEVVWQINGQAVTSLASLSQRLADIALIKADLPVIVDPGQDVPFGDVIDVYDTVLRVGLVNIQFTTRADLLGARVDSTFSCLASLTLRTLGRRPAARTVLCRVDV